jgi:type I restriction enzyme M protein
MQEKEILRKLGEETIYSAKGHFKAGDLSEYTDILGFCKSATLDEVKALNYALTPGRNVWLAEEEDEFNIAEYLAQLKTELDLQFAEEDALNKRIAKNLSNISFGV